MIRCINLFFSVIFLFLISLPTQSQASFESEFDSQYAINITLKEINGVYIPKDVEDAIKELDRLSSPEGKEMFKSGKEEDIGKTLVFGLGKWMIVNWNFYEGSRISHHLKQLGISLPDDMAQYLIVTYYRYLKELPLELEQRAAAIYEMRKKEQIERSKSKAKIQ